MIAEPQNIDEVIHAVQAQRPVLTKDKKGQVGNQKTKYADLVQVNDVVLKLLNDLHTIWTCRPHLEAGSFGLHYALRHVPSGTEVSGVWPLKLSENPQQMGSATTYGRRYALLAVTGIVADDEDDDGAAVANRGTAQRAPMRAQPARPAERTAQRAARPAAAGPPLPGEDSTAMTDPQRKRLHAMLREQFADRDTGLEWLSKTVGRPIASSNDLDKADATKVIDALMAEPGGAP